MKHTVKLRPGNYVHLDTYTRGVHPFLPLAAIAIIITLGVRLLWWYRKLRSMGLYVPGDRSQHYGPGLLINQ